MNVTCGHPATWNDKTIILYDDLVKGVHNNELYQDFEFQMVQKSKNVR